METMYYRKFKKVDQLLAEVGGIAKALLIIGFLICFPINRLNLHENLANNIFIFKKTEQKKDQVKKNNQEQQSDNNNNNTDNNSVNNKQFNNEVALSFLKIITPKLQAMKGMTLNHQQQSLLTKLDVSSNNAIQINGERLQVHKKSDTSEQSVEQNLLRSPQRLKYQQGVNSLTSQKQIDEQEEFKLDEQDNPAIKNMRDSDLFNENNVEGKLKLTWKQYIKYYIWPWGSIKNVRKQVDTSIKSIYNHVDVIKIIQLQLEFEKVKHLLLNEDQISLLKFLPKPIIDITEQENDINQNVKQRKTVKKNTKKIDLLNNQNSQDTAKEAADAFENIINKKELSETDVKLIMMLDDKILNYMLKHRMKQFNQKNNKQNSIEKIQQCTLQQPLQVSPQQQNQDNLKQQQLSMENDVKQNTLTLIKFNDVDPITNPTDPCDEDDNLQIKSHQIYQSNSPKLKKQISTLASNSTLRGLSKQTKKKNTIEGKQTVSTLDELNTKSQNFYKINIPTNTSQDLGQYKIEISKSSDSDNKKENKI